MAEKNKPLHIFAREIPFRAPEQVFLRLQHKAFALLLDSADETHRAGRYSFIACDPVETIMAKNGVVSLSNGYSNRDCPFDIMRSRLENFKASRKCLDTLPPFQGGAAGIFGYDLARGLETLPATAIDDIAAPDMAVGLYDQIISFDLKTRQCWIITHAPDETTATEKCEGLLSAINTHRAAPKQRRAALDWQSNFDADAYMEAIEKIIAYIRAGDIFQANLSQRFEADIPADFDPYAHYLHLRALNPAPFAGYMKLPNHIIASASPERFLTVQDGVVETCPIKGTRPHGHIPALDAVLRNELLTSEKDRAENTMIVDLLRNDLARACAAGSVTVTDLCTLESFAHVHHLVSRITGKLKPDCDPISLLRGAFPGGSITGAPKIRAMEIIEELEGVRRGPYCGAMGYIGFNGTMDTNILIRTLIYTAGKVYLQAGGGIVADSDANAEYQETFDKADALLHAFDHHEEDVSAAS